MSDQQPRAERFDGPSFEAKVRALRLLRSYYREKEAPGQRAGGPTGIVLDHDDPVDMVRHDGQRTTATPS